MKKTRKLTIGMLAHVDAGKTTLSEALLYKTGAIRNLGRVDHKDAFLDYNEQEKNRGITIFAGQAEFQIGENSYSLLDTPGHVDFSAEMERTLAVLDYAVLVISGKDGVQGHTITLWRLLETYKIPTFIFVNKMDMEGTTAEGILKELKEKLSDSCVEIENTEELATCDERLLEEFLAEGKMTDESISKAITRRNIYPTFFGSALKLTGIEEFIAGIDRLSTDEPQHGRIDEFLERDDSIICGDNFKAKVFRITRDQSGERFTHIKVLEGQINTRDTVQVADSKESLDGKGSRLRSQADLKKQSESEKITQIRIYSGGKFTNVESAKAGDLCAVAGLENTMTSKDMQLQAVMYYGVILPEGVNVHDAYTNLKQLDEEDPQLLVTWNEQNQEIQIKIMGKVQLEVLREIIRNRFGYEVEFGQGHISYKETIRKPVMGAGHFEPLRHYAEVHLLLEPLPRGSGLVFESAVSEDELDKNWQRLIFTHLMEKEHVGTLVAAPITDIKITILGGRAHEKHTEGGDFRQATYRALRQALRKSLDNGDMILLEPWYSFELSVPSDMIGRAMSDIQRMGGQFKLTDDMQVLVGKAPVSEMKDYIQEVAAYTKGYGQLLCEFKGYEPCHNQEDVVGDSGYYADRDVNNTADSVFCSHGAGHNVPWNESDQMMHVNCGNKIQSSRDGNEAFAGTGQIANVNRGSGFTSGDEDSDELMRIFDRTFNRDEKRKKWKPRIEAREIKSETERKIKLREDSPKTDYLLVDGYNIIFAWEELKELANVNIDAARESLIEIMCNYRGFRNCEVIIVFDAYKVKGGKRHVDIVDNITVVYTAEKETADSYIERVTYELAGKAGKTEKNVGLVRVATSDRAEQIIIMGNNAHKVSAQAFKEEVEQVNAEISDYLKRLSRKNNMENPNKLRIPNE